ncbi:hypothetical protein RJ639_041689 [Escallonia herrerae]|uniref:Uncharacterized protein n=1 Tax=Escallonia herrerae TaxID=1293975 RepID=A0AA89B602_9ASTE|nr:hypothetical protein RJ639_041689 [Escallonia herrerae]
MEPSTSLTLSLPGTDLQVYMIHDEMLPRAEACEGPAMFSGEILYVMQEMIRNEVKDYVEILGMLPRPVSRFLVKKSLGKAWSATAVEALCTDVLQLSSTPDWAFMREKRSQIAFLFGINDHWGPLQIVEEISKQVPSAVLAIEREGHSHAFSCTEAGSVSTKTLMRLEEESLEQKPLPSLHEAFSEVRREKSRKKIMMGRPIQISGESSALAAYGTNDKGSDN